MAREPDSDKIDYLTDILKKAIPAGQSAKPSGPSLQADRDIQPADALTPTGPLTVVPYETCFEMHAGCAFFRAPRSVEPSNAMALKKTP